MFLIRGMLFGLWLVAASWKAEVMVLLEYGEAIRGWHDQTTEHKQTGSSTRLLRPHSHYKLSQAFWFHQSIS